MAQTLVGTLEAYREWYRESYREWFAIADLDTCPERPPNAHRTPTEHVR